MLVFTIKLAAGKGVGKDFMQNLLRADLDNGLKGGGEILAIAVEDWRTVTHGRLTQRRMTANREFMIKPPTAQGLPHSRYFGETVRLAKLTEHRLIFINTLGESTFLPGDIDEKRRLILAVRGRKAGGSSRPARYSLL